VQRVLPILVLSSVCLGSTDVVRFGNAASESAHGLQAIRSQIIVGGLDQPARQLLPLEPATAARGTLEVKPMTTLVLRERE
jgi:hypothetical protein